MASVGNTLGDFNYDVKRFCNWEQTESKQFSFLLPSSLSDLVLAMFHNFQVEADFLQNKR